MVEHNDTIQGVLRQTTKDVKQHMTRDAELRILTATYGPAWIDKICKITGWNLSELAEQSGSFPSALRRMQRGDTPMMPSEWNALTRAFQKWIVTNGGEL